MESIPLQELQARWDRLRHILIQQVPEAGGLMVFSRINIYYLAGTLASGMLWLPLEGQPVLLCRRGFERAKLESPLDNIFPFKTYKDIGGILKDAGASLPERLAAEMNGLSWVLANSLIKNLSSAEFMPGDQVLALARAVKTEWELEILREAGVKHDRCFSELLPLLLKDGMTELEIAHQILALFFAEGGHGILRMGSYGEEVFLGHISAGDSGNYPSVFNGALGLRGMHPAVPHMGSGDKVWQKGEPLVVDCGFSLNGYQTDKTQVYWLGNSDGIPAPAQAAYDLCVEIQAWLAERLKPGQYPSELWDKSRLRAKKSGWEDGFMGLDGNKVEFIGHGIGLTVDEHPVLAKGFDLPLEAGMVISIEPKIGIRGFGMVGIENTFEVTPAGGRSLTGNEHRIICIPEG